MQLVLIWACYQWCLRDPWDRGETEIFAKSPETRPRRRILETRLCVVNPSVRTCMFNWITDSLAFRIVFCIILSIIVCSAEILLKCWKITPFMIIFRGVHFGGNEAEIFIAVSGDKKIFSIQIHITHHKCRSTRYAPTANCVNILLIITCI
jgi:hypothetical protein